MSPFQKFSEQCVKEYDEMTEVNEFHGIPYDNDTDKLIKDFLTSKLQALESAMPEIIICSAIKVDNLIIRGHRHCDCYHNLSLRPILNTTLAERVVIEGFITSTNRFVERKEAREIQEKAGIKSADKDGYRGDILYSEDLY